MLVVSRKLNERIGIHLPDGRVIVITLCKTESNQARIGIDAPKEFTVLREELEPGNQPPAAPSPPPRRPLPPGENQGTFAQRRLPHNKTRPR